VIIDFHTHCFPDDLAARAVPRLEEVTGIRARLDGTAASLLGSMAEAGIDCSAIQHIATRPGQERTINEWAARIQGPRIVFFGRLPPETPDWRGELTRLLDLGLPGVKLHPDYQGFFVDEPRMFPFYEALGRAGLIVLFHAGVDIGLPDPCHCPPDRLRRVIDRFPEGKWVAAHMGGYRYWDEVETHLLGRPVYLDTSYSYRELGAERMKDLIRRHGVGRILFGTDSPWVEQCQAVEEIRSLGLTAVEEAAILGGNAAGILLRS